MELAGIAILVWKVEALEKIRVKCIIGCVTFHFGHTDLVCIFPSVSVRFIIRKEDEHYVSVTAAYMHVLMHSETMQMLNHGEFPCQTIYLH